VHLAKLLKNAIQTNVVAITQRRLERGMDADAKAAVDAEAFGGHTALFGCVVSQPNFCRR